MFHNAPLWLVCHSKGRFTRPVVNAQNVTDPTKSRKPVIWVVTEFPGTSRPDRRPVVSCGQCIALDACQVFRNPSRKFYAAFVNGTMFPVPSHFGGRSAQKCLQGLRYNPQ